MTTSPSANEWRLALARRLAASYAASPKARVVMVAGSVGRGTADRYSDVELDVYWDSAPTDAERRAAATGAGGELLHLFPYEDDEWAEEISFGGFKVGTSTFLVSTIERYLDDVLVRFGLDPLAQMRLYSVLNARTLAGDEALVERWRARAAHYPPELTDAVLRQHLDFEGFGYAAEFLAARDDPIALYDLFGLTERQIMSALLGLNGVYLPNPRFKSLAELIGSLAVAPPNLAARLRLAFRLPPREGVEVLEGLIAELFALVDQHRPEFDTLPFRRWHAHRRGAWDEPAFPPTSPAAGHSAVE